jgi:hypothetical protein
MHHYCEQCFVLKNIYDFLQVKNCVFNVNINATPPIKFSMQHNTSVKILEYFSFSSVNLTNFANYFEKVAEISISPNWKNTKPSL